MRTSEHTVNVASENKYQEQDKNAEIFRGLIKKYRTIGAIPLNELATSGLSNRGQTAAKLVIQIAQKNKNAKIYGDLIAKYRTIDAIPLNELATSGLSIEYQLIAERQIKESVAIKARQYHALLPATAHTSPSNGETIKPRVVL